MTTVYRDSLDHVADELALLDRRLDAHLQRWLADRDGVVDEFRGLHVAHETVAQVLSTTPHERLNGVGAVTDTAGERRSSDVTGGRSDGHTSASATLLAHRHRIERREAQARTAGVDLRLVELRERFGLDRRAVDVLVLALAPELDLAYETVYSYLQNDVTRKRPTVELATRVLGRDWRERVAVRRLFAPSARLVRHGLVRLYGPAESHSLLARAVVVDERIVDFLLGGDDVDAALIDVVSTVETATSDPAFEPVSTAARDVVDRLADHDAPMLVLSGPAGVGKRAVATALAAARETPVLSFVVESAPEDDQPDLFARVVREARLRDATLYVETTPERAETVVRALDGAPGAVVLSTATPWHPRRSPETHTVVTLDLPTPSYADRRRLWAEILDNEGVETVAPAEAEATDETTGADEAADAVDVDRLSATFRLTPGGIRDAVKRARDESGAVTADGLYAACRAQSGPTLGALARRVTPTYRWDDIVLPADKRRQLREVAAHVRNRGTVHDDWGFGEAFSLGNGLVVLFTGPSGTGKTMAAEIIARDVGLDLYKIDLSQVVSKYIGETEKQLRAIFDEAERSDAILLFDEADALFGKRSEVKDSHDRYANIEVNYLLQRVEEHDGTVVLTTNFRRNLDEAFLRRIHLSVDFPRPDETSRAAIWRGIFPAETPVSALDVEFLTRFDFAGGNIRNVAQTAAMLAAEDGGCVEMDHVVWAAYRELQKTGAVVRPEEFGAYRELLGG